MLNGYCTVICIWNSNYIHIYGTYKSKSLIKHGFTYVKSFWFKNYWCHTYNEQKLEQTISNYNFFVFDIFQKWFVWRFGRCYIYKIVDYTCTLVHLWMFCVLCVYVLHKATYISFNFSYFSFVIMYGYPGCLWIILDGRDISSIDETAWTKWHGMQVRLIYEMKIN